MNSITLSCRFGYIKLVDMNGRTLSSELPCIGPLEQGQSLSQLCLGLKGNQTFEKAVFVTGQVHKTNLSIRSAVAIMDRMWVVCGMHAYCLQLPSLNELWRHQHGFMECMGLMYIEDDILIVYDACVARVTVDGTVRWLSEHFETGFGFPVIESNFLIREKKGCSELRIHSGTGIVMAENDEQ